MKIILPHKISSEIQDIIHEAKDHLVIVSPYVDFWLRISNDLKSAINRGVKIDFFTRYDVNNTASWEQIESLGIKPRLIPNLHAKLYFNEKSGVISSMNLLASSNSSSIEIGCKLELSEEISELNNFVSSFIMPHETIDRPSEEDIYLSKEKFTECLANFTRTSIYYKNGQFNIKTGRDNLFLSINKVNNTVSISAIVSGKQADEFPTKSSDYFKSKYFQYQLIPGGHGQYDFIQADSTIRLSNSFLDKLLVREKKVLIDEIAELLNSVTEFKTSSR